MEDNPSQREVESRATSSRSGSDRSSTQETAHLSALQEYIRTLTEEEWMVFSGMLRSPMTRPQFTELCMTVLKVVSLSSISVILPAYVCVVKDAESSTSKSSTPTTLSAITSTERSPSSAFDRSSLATPPKLLVTDEATDESGESSESERALSTSHESAGGPVRDIWRSMKGVLANLRKTVAWFPYSETPVSAADTDVARSVSELSVQKETARLPADGDTSHDAICITAILERLLSSGNIHHIARNLVSQVQGVLQSSSSSTSIPVAAGKSLSDSVLSSKVKRAPTWTTNAFHLVYAYAEDAIKNLLRPYFLPLVSWDANEDSASSKISSPRRRSQSAGAAATKDPSDVSSLLGLHKAECNCLMTELIQRLPANIRYQETVEPSRSPSATGHRFTRSPSHTLSEVANLFARVMTSQVMDLVDSELWRHDQASQRPSSAKSSDEPRVISSPDTDGRVTDEELAFLLDTSPGPSGGLISRLIQRFLAEFRFSESALSDASDEVRGAAASSPIQSGTKSCEPDMVKDSKSPARKLESMLGLFTSVMVHNVVDILSVDSAVKMDRETSQTKMAPAEEECTATEQSHSSSRPSTSKSFDHLDILVANGLTDGDTALKQKESAGSPSNVTSMVDSGNNDNGCLVTVLMLRLLAKMKNQPATSADMMDSSQKLIEQILSEFNSASGTPNFNTYAGNLKIQALYRTIDRLLLREFGPEAVLQNAATQDASFDNILLLALRRELLGRPDDGAITIPSAPDTPLCPQFVPAADDGQTGRKERIRMPRMRFKMKMPKRGSKKMTPANGFSGIDDQLSKTPASDMPCDETSPSNASRQKTRKQPSFFLRLFPCCTQGIFDD